MLYSGKCIASGVVTDRNYAERVTLLEKAKRMDRRLRWNLQVLLSTWLVLETLVILSSGMRSWWIMLPHIALLAPFLHVCTRCLHAEEALTGSLVRRHEQDLNSFAAGVTMGLQTVDLRAEVTATVTCPDIQVLVFDDKRTDDAQATQGANLSLLH